MAKRTTNAALSAGWSAVAMFFVARNRWNQPANRKTLARLIDETRDEFLRATSAEAAHP